MIPEMKLTVSHAFMQIDANFDQKMKSFLIFLSIPHLRLFLFSSCLVFYYSMKYLWPWFFSQFCDRLVSAKITTIAMIAKYNFVPGFLIQR